MTRTIIAYTFDALLYAGLFFVLSYEVIFRGVAEGSILPATLWNFGLIFAVLLFEKVAWIVAEKVYYWSKRDGRDTWLTGPVRWFLRDASYKASLYLFYIVLLICTAILAAAPDTPVLRDFYDYFQSVRYGLLVLVAADKFLEQTIKDVRYDERFKPDDEK